MNTNEMAAFARLWGGMAEMYGKTVSDAVVAMAFQALERYELADIRRAINSHVADPQRGQFIAKPADLILHMDGDPASRALLAWSKAEDAMKAVGTYKSVVFDDPAIMATIEDMGGWVEFGKMSLDELPFKRNEFEKRYRGYMNKPPTHHPKVLGGIFNIENQKWREHVEEPVLIGNPEKALLVHQSGGDKPSAFTRLSAMLDRPAKQLEDKTQH